MKHLASMATILAVALMVGECSAEPPGRGKGANGQRKEGLGQRPGPGGDRDRDPAQMIARIMTEFDKDGDSKLDVRELTEMLTAMRERRENGGERGARAGAGRKPQGLGGAGAKGGGQAAGKGDQAAAAGGAKPKRPPAE